MSSPLSLSRRKTTELAEIALSLGLSDEGQKKQLIERIQNYIDVHGTTDPILMGLAREDSADVPSGHISHQSVDEENLADLSSANEGDNSNGGIDGKLTKTARTTTTKNIISRLNDMGHGSSRNFENKLHQAKDLALHLEETLHGHHEDHDRSRGRHHRSYTHEESNHRHRQHHDSKHHHEHAHDRHEGFLNQVWAEWYRFACAGSCGLTQIADKLHDVGSTSRGLVLLTLLLETVVFVTSAYREFGASGDHWYGSWWALVADWKNFLRPFFVYYGTLFVLPTLLSQLFNVDISRSQHTHPRDHGSGPLTSTTTATHTTTGLLSPKTTSGLSYFVFKFALTYLSMPRDHGSHYSGIWQGCKALYEYVPVAVGLAISGVGVILALAESVVSAH
ncbi:hypothetical protein CPB97_006452 [Podila verticillata]|nr:hypothetical protein CPB97_006452 [Podila verticillata]